MADNLTIQYDIDRQANISVHPKKYGRKIERKALSLLLMVEKQRKGLDNISVGGMLLTDLSEAFDCRKQALLNAKLAAYGFDGPSLCFVYSYPLDRTQRTKVNNAYSSYNYIKYDTPQGFLFLILVFLIYFCGTLTAT